ncbi:MAG: GNAT family N-acetyltransferase [Dissulfurispiraceae bacterium]
MHDNNNHNTALNEDTSFQTEIIKGSEDEYLNAIFKLEPFFPVKIQDSEDKLRENLNSAANINAFLKKDGQVVGWLLATPHNDAVKELENDDTEMREDADRYYIDKLAVLPEYRQGLNFVKLVYAVIEEANKRGFYKFSSHVLSDNGLNKVLARIFGKMLTKRRIVSLAMLGNASFEYMEMTYKE